MSLNSRNIYFIKYHNHTYEYEYHPGGNDDKTTSNGIDVVTTTSSSEVDNREESKNYFLRVRPPKINYSTIVIKP